MSNGTLVWNEARDRGLEKWQRGQLEHGGDLYRKPTLDEAIDEAIDLIPYLLIHRSHVRIAILHLKAIDLRTLPPAAPLRSKPPRAAAPPPPRSPPDPPPPSHRPT